MKYPPLCGGIFILPSLVIIALIILGLVIIGFGWGRIDRIEITAFSEQDKMELCAGLDIAADDSIDLIFLKHLSGFRIDEMCLKIRANDKTQLRRILANYSQDHGENYSIIESDLDAGFELTESYADPNNNNMRAWVFTNQQDTIVYFYSRTTNDLIRRYIKEQIRKGNYAEWQYDESAYSK